MKKAKTHTLFISVILIIILGFIAWQAFVNNNKNGPQRVFSSGDVYNLTLYDYQGNEVQLSKFNTNKLLIINFWASWCLYCNDELIFFSRLQEEYGNKIKIIAVNRAESLSIARNFTDKLDTENVTFLLDPEDTLYKMIDGFAMPETIFISRKGTIEFHKKGPVDSEEIKRKIYEIVELKN